jgi:uncharacterized protein YndB with AHSA1/START domain
MNRIKDSVKREIVVNATLKVVWEAMTKPEHLNRWYTKNAEIDFRIGGKGFLNHGWGATSEGIYTKIEELRRFVLESVDQNFKTITSLEQVENGIKVSIEYQSNFIEEMSEANKENMLFGTIQFLENLKSVYETGIDNRSKMWRISIGITHATNNEGAIGTKVLHVKKDSVAEAAGIRQGDSIQAIDQETISGYETFERVLNKKAVNQLVTFTIERKHKKLTISCLADRYPVQY